MQREHAEDGELGAQGDGDQRADEPHVIQAVGEQGPAALVAIAEPRDHDLPRVGGFERRAFADDVLQVVELGGHLVGGVDQQAALPA